MPGPCDSLQRASCGGFHGARRIRLDDLQMRQDQFVSLVRELNLKLQGQMDIPAPTTKKKGAEKGALLGAWMGSLAGVIVAGTSTIAFAPLMLGVGAAAACGAVGGIAGSPDESQEERRYKDQKTAAFFETEQFFRSVFVPALRQCGFAVDLDDEIEHVSCSSRLTFRCLKNIVQQELAVALQDADAILDSSDDFSGNEAAARPPPMGQRRKRPGHRQRLRKKQFWEVARASTPNALD